MFTKKLARLRILLIVLFPSLFSRQFKPAAFAQSTKLPNAYVGVWEGSGTQNNGEKWSILMALTPGDVNSVVGTTAYPSLVCGGKLTFRRISNQFNL